MSTRLTYESVRDTHPDVPEDFDTTMERIVRYGGPYDCRVCGPGSSLLSYRCSKCGTDIAGY